MMRTRCPSLTDAGLAQTALNGGGGFSGGGDRIAHDEIEWGR